MSSAPSPAASWALGARAHLESKLTAVAVGVFVPFFFVVSGMDLDVTALFASPSGLAKLGLFFVRFLAVRGVPALSSIATC